MRFVRAVVAAGAALGCARNQPQDVAAGVEFALALGGTARLGGGDLQIAFSEVVEDSRCPIDAICVQAGRATVRLTVDRAGSSRALLLSTREGTATDTAGPYQVRLVSLLPAPRAAEPHPADSQRVTLLIDSK